MSEHDDDVQTIECGEGVTIHIKHDDSPTNPRTEWDNLAVMACWHDRHILGDGDEGSGKQRRWTPVHSSPNVMWAELIRDMAPSAGQMQPAFLVIMADKYMADEYTTWVAGKSRKERVDVRRDYIREQFLQDNATAELRTAVRKMLEGMGLLIKPLYLYDHSGITISTGAFSCPWDSGQVGYIYLTPAKVAENWPDKKLDDPVHYKHDNSTKTLRERALDVMDGEVEVYDQYLTGDVYGYVITRAKEDSEDEDADDELDSCWGFFGEECAIEEAKSAAQGYVEQYQDPAHMAGADI